MLKEGFVDLAGLKLHYVDWGGAGQPLVLLAGLGATAKVYSSLAPKLATRFRVVGLTRRGHGRSDRPASGYDLDHFVEDICRFLDAMGIDRTILVGHSMAGYEMPFLAQRYPQRVEAIVFLDALYAKLADDLDLSGDPVDPLLQIEPTREDFASRESALAFYQRVRPDQARIWCEAIELDCQENVKIHVDGQIEPTFDFGLLDEIWKAVQPCYPEYDKIRCPMLAIVPLGDYHPAVPVDATAELRYKADQY
jgi:pimeloyl-ACP methyl ester carboxylesterase